jgi:hypothetical protein
MPEIDPRLPLGTQAGQQHVAVGVAQGALGIEAALAHELLDQRMVEAAGDQLAPRK